MSLLVLHFGYNSPIITSNWGSEHECGLYSAKLDFEYNIHLIFSSALLKDCHELASEEIIRYEKRNINGNLLESEDFPLEDLEIKKTSQPN